MRHTRHSIKTVGIGLHELRFESCIFCSYALKISQPNVYALRGVGLQIRLQFSSTSIGGSTMSAQSSSKTEQANGLENESEKFEAEAAHYALMRRLAPVIRHNMAGTLQPIAMVAAMLERRLQKADADPEALLRNARDIVALSKEAAASCVDLMSWLAPKEKRLVPAEAGIAECLGMVVTQLSFKGFSVIDNTGGIAARLPQSALRNVLTAALIALTDAAAAPCKVFVQAEFTQGVLSLRLELKPHDDVEPMRVADKPPYRLLEWRDVQALALQESVRLTRGDNRATLRFEASAAADSQALAEAAQA